MATCKGISKFVVFVKVWDFLENKILIHQELKGFRFKNSFHKNTCITDSRKYFFSKAYIFEMFRKNDF
jgi:hypothetical protein